MEVLREGYTIPLCAAPPLSPTHVNVPSYSPTSLRGVALEKELQALLSKSAIEPAPLTPGFYSRLFVVPKHSGGWRPIIDLSTFNHFVVKTSFRMETLRSVLASVRQDDWMVSIDLKDAYLQVPVHPRSRKYLRFVVQGRAFQFRALPFGLTTAPQVFTRVMAVVSSVLHLEGIRMLRYLDDWLIQSSSRAEACRARDRVLQLCSVLGISVNMDKSDLVPTQVCVYLGTVLNSRTLKAFATPARLEKWLQLAAEFLSSKVQPASSWQVVLGHLSSLSQLVPGGHLRMRSLQLRLNQAWDYDDPNVLVSWDSNCEEDLLWWCAEDHLHAGVSLVEVPPDRAFWSDASDTGWGANTIDQYLSGVWSPEERALHISARELLAVQKGLTAFVDLLRGRVVAVFCDNTTAIAYLRREGGTFSPRLNAIAQSILRWAETVGISLRPQFILGAKNVIADSLSRVGQVIASEWTLCQEVVDDLIKRWPATVDLFATSLNHRLPVYFAPAWDPMAAAVDAMLQPWDHLQAYAFPPFALLRQVINKFRRSERAELTLVAPLWPQKEWFPDLMDLAMAAPVQLPFRRDLLQQPHCHRLHLRPQVLNLHAWRLSSGSPGMKVSLVE